MALALWVAGRAGTLRAQPAEGPIEVEVRAAPLRHSEEAPSVASSVVSGEALREPGASSADVLARVPGVQVNRTGAQSDLATASIRGSNPEQVPVYLAGVRLNDDVSGTADLSTIPLFMIDRIEVYRGNAPARADRLGLGGAIFFWPKLPARPRLGLGGEVGSFGAHGEWLAAEVGDRHAGSLMAIRHSEADNDYPFTDDRGQRFQLDERDSSRQNADFDQYDVWAVSRLQLAEHARLISVLSALQREQGVTGLSVVPARNTRARTRRLLAGQSLALPCGQAGACRFEFDTSLLAAGVAFHDPGLELRGLGARRLDNEGERLSQAVALNARVNRSLKAHLRLAGAFETLRIDRDSSAVQRAERRSLLPSAGLDWQATSAWTLFLLGSVECHGTQGTQVARRESVIQKDGPCGVAEPAGRVGGRYLLSPATELLANLGRYVRVPSLGELYGTSAFTQGNANLDAERGLSADLGVRANGSLPVPLSWSVDAFAFARQVQELIRYRRTSSESVAPFNVAEARLLGIEAMAAADAFGHLRLQSSTTLVDPRETTDDPALDPTVNDLLPFTARMTASASGEWYVHPRPEPLGMSRASLKLSYFYRSARYADLAGQTVLGAEHYLDAEAVAAFDKNRWVARLAVKNLLDSRATDLIGLPAPGRSFHAALEAWF